MSARRVLAAAVLLCALTACGGGTGAPVPPPSATEVPVPSARTLSPPTASAPPASASADSGGGDEEGSGGGKPRNERGVEATAQAGGPVPGVTPVSCPAATVTVDSAGALTAALADARPGAVVELADGVYDGRFVATVSGTAAAPIFLCGGRGAVLDGGGTRGGYVLHLDGAAYWRLVGFTVRNGQKGVMADGTTGTVIQDLAVGETGDEAIHLRRHSTDNLVLGNEISGTGKRRDKFGEGVYVGSAVSNWCTITDCRPDRSDRNVIAGNRISDTTSEAVDIKEGTTGGLLVGNTFDGAGTTAADSWVDVKGTAWTIKDNRGTNPPLDGFQTHEIEDRWGDRNVFTGNVITGGPTRDDEGKPGHGIALRPTLDNVVRCDNRVEGGLSLSNVTCR